MKLLFGWLVCRSLAVSFPPLCGWRSVYPSVFTLHLQAGVKEKHEPKDTQVCKLAVELKVHQCTGNDEEESRLRSRLHGPMQVLRRDVQRTTGRSRPSEDRRGGHELAD